MVFTEGLSLDRKLTRPWQISKLRMTADFPNTRSFPWGSRADCEQSYGFLGFSREILRPWGSGLGAVAPLAGCVKNSESGT